MSMSDEAIEGMWVNKNGICSLVNCMQESLWIGWSGVSMRAGMDGGG